MLNMKLFRAKRDLTQADIVAKLKPFYPGIDASLVSKVESPMTYGVCLITEAELELVDAYHDDYRTVTAKGSDRHKLTGRVSCRMSEDKKHNLIVAGREDGFKDVNSLLNHLINLYLYERMY